MREAEEESGEGERGIGNEAPQDDRRRITEKRIVDGAGTENGSEEDGGLEAAGSGPQAGVDAEDPVEG
jgi:hypothetical protein